MLLWRLQLKKLMSSKRLLDAAVNEDISADHMDLPDVDGMFVTAPRGQAKETIDSTCNTTSTENGEVEPVERSVKKEEDKLKQFQAEDIQDAIEAGVSKKMKEISAVHAEELKALRSESEERVSVAEKLMMEKEEASATMQRTCRKKS